MNPLTMKRLFAFGRIFSPAYACLMRQRALCYRHGLLKSHQLKVPICSVGNLTMGGTGKTPMVIYLARLLAQFGKPAVVSRGYGGKSTADVNVVADGVKICMEVDQAGDEPFMIAKTLGNIAVLTGKRRILPARYAVAHLGAEVLILDDGFQHMGLARDLNLVLFSAHELLGNGLVFPGGLLREPLSALERADAFVVTGVDELLTDKVHDFHNELRTRFGNKPFFTAAYELIEGRERDTQKKFAGQDLAKRRCLAFCGLATPRAFLQTLNRQHVNPVHFQTYPDHHVYGSGDFAEIDRLADRFQADMLLTTEKDAVKLTAYRPARPLVICRAGLQMSDAFDSFVLERLALGKDQ